MKQARRISTIFIIVFIASSLLILRLFYIQVLNGRFLSEKASVQKSEVFSDKIRGDILDRNNISLLDSYLDTYAILSPGWLSASQRNMLIEGGLLKTEKVEKPIILNISQENQAQISSLKGKTPGVYVYKKKVRYGPAALATHVVGYNGKTGIEKAFDHILKSNQKELEVITDGFGQPIAGLSDFEAETGKFPYIKLTIDADFQKAVEEVMDESGKRGAVVVLDARTGEILSMASRPNYKQYRLKEYLKNDDAPLINRAIEAFTPGSIFKVILLAAALEEGITELDETFECIGFVKVGGNTFKCSSYEHGGHGTITLKDATAHSCNSVFIQLGMRLGKEKIIKYAKSFGLGEIISIGLPEEKSGLIPNHEDVYYQDIGNLSIGQGKIEMTPLQAAQTMMVIANNGVLKSPYILQQIVDAEGKEQTVRTSGDRRIISETTAKKVREALSAVTEYGTGIRANNKKSEVKCAGKTGTAEIVQNTYHAWFVGYFPEEKPRYVISVFLEKGGSGSTQAAPIFREIADRLLDIEKQNIKTCTISNP